MTIDLHFNGLTTDINQRIEKIWQKPPAEIGNLLNVKGPYRQSFNAVIYAYWDLNALASTLWVFRRNVKNGVQIDNVVIVAASIVSSHAKSCEAYGLTDTSALLEKASGVMADVKRSDEFVEILERLIVYLNRMGMAGWLDLLIPWKKLGDTFSDYCDQKGAIP